MEFTKEYVSTEFTKEQQNLAQSFSSLSRPLEETRHGGYMVDDDVAATKLEKKRKSQFVDFCNEMSDEEYIHHLETEVARLTTKIVWLKPNQDRKMMRFVAATQKNWPRERMMDDVHSEQRRVASQSSLLQIDLNDEKAARRATNSRVAELESALVEERERREKERRKIKKAQDSAEKALKSVQKLEKVLVDVLEEFTGL